MELFKTEKKKINSKKAIFSKSPFCQHVEKTGKADSLTSLGTVVSKHPLPLPFDERQVLRLGSFPMVIHFALPSVSWGPWKRSRENPELPAICQSGSYHGYQQAAGLVSQLVCSDWGLLGSPSAGGSN